eukprot:3892311-Amphidinium_carterae.1
MVTIGVNQRAPQHGENFVHRSPPTGKIFCGHAQAIGSYPTNYIGGRSMDHGSSQTSHAVYESASGVKHGPGATDEKMQPYRPRIRSTRSSNPT